MMRSRGRGRREHSSRGVPIGEAPGGYRALEEQDSGGGRGPLNPDERNELSEKTPNAGGTTSYRPRTTDQPYTEDR